MKPIELIRRVILDDMGRGGPEALRTPVDAFNCIMLGPLAARVVYTLYHMLEADDQYWQWAAKVKALESDVPEEAVGAEKVELHKWLDQALELREPIRKALRRLCGLRARDGLNRYHAKIHVLAFNHGYQTTLFRAPHLWELCE